MSYYDDRMAERERDRHLSRAERELNTLEADTEAINKGMSNPLLWLLLVGGVVAALPTGGISLIVTLMAGIAMSGGPKTIVGGAVPMSVDVAAPKAGCVRILCSLGTIALIVLAATVFGLLILFENGVIG